MKRYKKKLKPWHLDISCYNYAKAYDTYRPSKGKWNCKRRSYWLKKYMGNQGCKDCGLKDSRVLCFDHRDPSKKSFSILSKCNNHLHNKGFNPLRQITNEVRKCDIRCHNCHFIKTQESNDTASTTISYEKRLRCFNEYIRNQPTN